MGKKLLPYTEEAMKNALSFNTEVSLSLKIECTICGKRHEDSSEYDPLPFCEIEEVKEVKDKFIESLFKKGWREAVSKTYGQIGITCPKCIKDPENKCTIR